MSEDLTKKLPPTSDEKLTLILTTVQELSGRMGTLEGTLLADMATLHEAQLTIATEMRAMKRDISNRFVVLSNTLLDTRADYNDLRERVTRLELNGTPPNTQT
jgi:hypothetical protein